MYQWVRNVRFQKIWHALFSSYLLFEIRPFDVLPTSYWWFQVNFGAFKSCAGLRWQKTPALIAAGNRLKMPPLQLNISQKLIISHIIIITIIRDIPRVLVKKKQLKAVCYGLFKSSCSEDIKYFPGKIGSATLSRYIKKGLQGVFRTQSNI